jgi:hypothetical protein
MPSGSARCTSSSPAFGAAIFLCWGSCPGELGGGSLERPHPSENTDKQSREQEKQ